MVTIHHRLEVWQRSIAFAESIYKITPDFPKQEEYGLSLQLKRAAVSIPSNIAEGAARKSRREFVQFLYIAAGSASEIDTQLALAFKLGFISAETNASLDSDLDVI